MATGALWQSPENDRDRPTGLLYLRIGSASGLLRGRDGEHLAAPVQRRCRTRLGPTRCARGWSCTRSGPVWTRSPRPSPRRASGETRASHQGADWGRERHQSVELGSCLGFAIRSDQDELGAEGGGNRRCHRKRHFAEGGPIEGHDHGLGHVRSVTRPAVCVQGPRSVAASMRKAFGPRVPRVVRSESELSPRW